MINLMMPVNLTSYGLVGYNIALNYPEQFSFFPIHSRNQIILEPGINGNFLSQSLLNAEKWDSNQPCLKLWHQHQMDIFPKCSKRIGFPIFELDSFSDVEKHNLKSLDKIIVTCNWAKDVIHSHMSLRNIDVSVVNLGTDTSIFFDRHIPRPQNKPYTFLNIGKMEKRKGHDYLVDMFNTAFNPTENVELQILWHNPFCSSDEMLAAERQYKASPMGHKIVFINRLPTQNHIAQLINDCDAYISPARAEGWNMPLYDALACNKPVITTNCTAHKDYCTTDNSFLVEVPELEIAHDSKFFNNQIGRWHTLDSSSIKKFAEIMRHCYTKQIFSLKKGNIRTWKVVTQELHQQLI